MGLRELLGRAVLANVVAAAIMVTVTAYAAWTGDAQLLRDMAFLAAGYLFGVATPRVHGGGRG